MKIKQNLFCVLLGVSVGVFIVGWAPLVWEGILVMISAFGF